MTPFNHTLSPNIFPVEDKRPLSAINGKRRVVRQWLPQDVVRTPRAFFKQLDEEFHFTLDAAALPSNALCDAFYTPEQDGLAYPWSGAVWCNPPYSHIAPWVAKADAERLQGVTTVLLLPVRSDLGWWHRYVLEADEIRFIRGRLKFEDWSTNAPFPSCLVIFRGMVTVEEASV